MTTRAIVIGDGVDARVAAHRLARSGLAVQVLREPTSTEPRPPIIGWMPSQLAHDSGLRAHDAPADAAWLTIPLPDRGRLELVCDITRTAEAIRKVSARDAARWPDFCVRMRALAGVLEKLYMAPPPDPLAGSFGDVIQLLRSALDVRALGRAGLEDFMRIATMPVSDLLDEWFESAALKGALGALGVMHLCQGPRSGGTALNFLHHHAGCAAGVFRQAVFDARAAAAGSSGMALVEGRAAEIIVKRGRAEGVRLADGREVAAAVVVSCVHPKRTLLELVDSGWLDPELVHAVRKIRGRGVTAFVKLELDRNPGFSTLAVAPSLDYLERAYDDAKYGRASAQPYIEARYSQANGSGHEAHVHVQYTPYDLRDAQWDVQQDDRVARAAIDRLDSAAPGFGRSVVGHSVLSPRALEGKLGCPEGQAYHAELAPDQFLWMRPVPELARYRTPIDGLYLCGPAMHPGAGVLGAAAMHAAHAVLRDLKTKKER